MPHVRSAALAAALPLVAGSMLGACLVPNEAPSADVDLRAREPRTYYVETGAGRTLFFETWLANPSDSAQTFNLFAYASDDLARPNSRAVYPPRALSSMPADRRFAVADPAVGLPITLAPGDSGRFAGALPMPQRSADGRAIHSEAFRDLTFYAFDTRGRNVYRSHWPLVRVRGEETQ